MASKKRHWDADRLDALLSGETHVVKPTPITTAATPSTGLVMSPRHVYRCPSCDSQGKGGSRLCDDAWHLRPNPGEARVASIKTTARIEESSQPADGVADKP